MRTKAFRIIEAVPNQFLPGFFAWLTANWDLYEQFEKEAIKAGERRAHYSAHTIVEYMRHETMLSEKGDDDFKLNEAWSSSLARLFAHLNPTYETLFEFRVRECGVVAAFCPIPSTEAS